MNANGKRLRIVLLVACFLLSSGIRADDFIDSPMYRNPDLPPPPIKFVLPDGARELWLRALERPETDYRIRAAEAIAKAHLLDGQSMEATVGPLLTALNRPDQPRSVRVALVQTLTTLDARKAADSLMGKLCNTGPREITELVDPVLARWDHRPARAGWLERLRDPDASTRTRLTAAQALATVREAPAVETLRELTMSDRTVPPLRLEAARALGRIRAEGLEADAERLSADASPKGMPARLAAASLLRQHTSASAVKLLQRLIRDPDPAVGSVAVARLLELDPKHALPDLDFLLASADANLRSHGVEVLFREPTLERLRSLGDRLDDTDTTVREQARAHLERLAGKAEFRDPAIAEGARLLAAAGWRGQERAAILLARLDHKPAATRLGELLPAERPEVFVVAAWALRKLAVPETYPGVARYVDGQLTKLLKPPAPSGPKERPADWLDHQMSQLNQMFGEQKYTDADPVLRRFVPKPMGGIAESRAAGIWALGLIHEGKSIPDLTSAAEARLNDTASIPPEDSRVRRMAATLLGRLDSKTTVPSLRMHFSGEPTADAVSNACGWAIERLTGEKVPAPKTVERVRRDWFLSPSE